MIKQVITCDKCGDPCAGDYFIVYRTDAEKDKVIGKADICGKCYGKMLYGLHCVSSDVVEKKAINWEDMEP